MSVKRFEDFESDIDDFVQFQDNFIDGNPETKLERRRKIEDIFEEKRLREELADF